MTSVSLYEYDDQGFPVKIATLGESEPDPANDIPSDRSEPIRDNLPFPSYEEAFDWGITDLSKRKYNTILIARQEAIKKEKELFDADNLSQANQYPPIRDRLYAASEDLKNWIKEHNLPFSVTEIKSALHAETERRSQEAFSQSEPIRDRDKPAFPANLDAIEWGMSGLTKREYAVIRIAGDIATACFKQFIEADAHYLIAHRAQVIADEIFNQLEKTNDPNKNQSL